MAEAETQMSMDSSDSTDYLIAILGALLFGAIVGGITIGLIAGYQYAASEFLNVYPPNNLRVQQWIQIAFTWSPVLVGLLATIPAFRFLLKLK